MGKILLYIGGSIILYEIIAYLTSLPMLSDFSPIGMFLSSVEKSQYHKIVAGERLSLWPYAPFTIGILLILVGYVVSKRKS